MRGMYKERPPSADRKVAAVVWALHLRPGKTNPQPLVGNQRSPKFSGGKSLLLLCCIGSWPISLAFLLAFGNVAQASSKKLQKPFVWSEETLCLLECLSERVNGYSSHILYASPHHQINCGLLSCHVVDLYATLLWNVLVFSKYNKWLHMTLKRYDLFETRCFPTFTNSAFRAFMNSWVS